MAVPSVPFQPELPNESKRATAADGGVVVGQGDHALLFELAACAPQMRAEFRTTLPGRAGQLSFEPVASTTGR